MMAYHRPIPERKLRGGGAGGGMFNAWVQAEKLMQIAMMLPSAGFIGWLAGYGLDRWLHQGWIEIAGAVFGIVAGLVAAVRLAMAYGAGTGQKKSGNIDNGSGAGESGSGTPDNAGDSGKTL